MKLPKRLSSFDKVQGYEKGVQDSLVVIIKILADNDITMAEKEFWKEYKLLKKEGVI